jgi:hypothetical protein
MVLATFWAIFSQTHLVTLIIKLPGANPTTVSYNASAVKIYNATRSLVRFENKDVFVYREETL